MAMTGFATTRRARTAAAMVSTVVTALLVLTGCSALDSADSVADRFTDRLSMTAGVRDVTGTAQRTGPFSTELDADVTVADDLGATEVIEIAEVITDFQTASVTVSALLTNSWLTVPITSNPEINRQVIEVAYEIAETEGVASVLAAMYMENQFSVEVLTEKDPFELFSQVIEESPYTMSLFVSDTEETLTVSGNTASDMTAVTAVAEGLLDADLTIAQLTVQPSAVSLSVGTDRDADEAERIAASIDDTIAVEVSVETDGEAEPAQ